MNIVRYLLRIRWIEKIFKFSKKITFPGFDGQPIYKVMKFFLRGLQKGDIQTHARSIAFSFFLSLFPTIIFIFTLIPYIPIKGFQDHLLEIIQQFVPENTYGEVRQTIEEIIKQQHSGLLSFGFVFALYVSSNGIMSMMNSFNRTFHNQIKRSGIKKRLVSIFLTILLSTLMMIAILLIIISEYCVHTLVKSYHLKSNWPVFFLQSGKWIILVALCLAAVSSLYYYGSAGREKWQFFSSGSTFATLLIVLTSIAFNFFIMNFGHYNTIYGSIGTLIIILTYIFFNCLQLLIGFELNASIDRARKERSVNFKQVPAGIQK